MVSDEQYESANVRGAVVRGGPTAVRVRYVPHSKRVVIMLSNDIEVSFPATSAQGLEHATPTDLEAIEISPSGLGLHFPKVDADIYLPALLQGFLGSEAWIQRQLAARAARGGAAKTEAKAKAARANGAKGGRPRKVTSERIETGKSL